MGTGRGHTKVPGNPPLNPRTPLLSSPLPSSALLRSPCSFFSLGTPRQRDSRGAILSGSLSIYSSPRMCRGLLRLLPIANSLIATMITRHENKQPQKKKEKKSNARARLSTCLRILLSPPPLTERVHFAALRLDEVSLARRAQVKRKGLEM